MKKLNDRATKILLALLERKETLIATVNGKVRHIQAEVQTQIGKYRAIGLTFWEYEDEYRTQEPEITIIHDKVTDEYFPASIVYYNEHILSNSATLAYGELKMINEKIQTDHVEITENFLESIAEHLNL